MTSLISSVSDLAVLAKPEILFAWLPFFMDTIFEDPTASRSNGKRNTAIAIACALVLTGTVLGGYLYLQKRHQEAEIQKQLSANPPTVPAPIPVVQVTQDEARIKGSSAVINGTVQNISKETFTHIQVEFELTRRSDGTVETRLIPLAQSDLSPGQQSSYSVTLSKEYKSLKVSRVLAADGKADLPFHAVPGAKRPLEGPPPTKKVILSRRMRAKGEEFINTPDNPSRIP